MPRTDENGKGLPVVLSYMLDRQVPAVEIYGALGIARNTYHNRIAEDDFPNAEECRLLAERFDLNPVELMVKFGLIDDRHVEGYATRFATRSTTTAIATRPRKTRPKSLVRRSDVPKL